MATPWGRPPKIHTLAGLVSCACTASLISAQTPSHVPPTQEISPGLTVTAEEWSYDLLTQTYTFRHGVVAHYDVTTVHSDTLVVNLTPGAENADAEGAVEVDDPAGMVMASSLKFTWKKDGQSAHARDVMIHIANVMLHADRADLTPTRWDLYVVDASNCKENPPLFSVHTPHLTVYPGKDGIIRKPSLKVLGAQILTIPDQTFNLDSRTQGLQYPNFSYHAGQGVGISLKEGFLLNSTTNAAFTYGAVHDSLPGYGGVITKSLVSNASTTSILTPASDFSERFRYGFLENVNVASPNDETRVLSTPRNSVSVGSAWNSFVIDRPDAIAYTKPIEAIYEYGGHSGSLDYLADARYESIQQYRQSFHERLLLGGSGGFKPQRLSQNLRLIGRLDTQGFVGNDFGWLRAICGVVYSPIRQLTLTGGAFASAAAGHALYPIDDLYARDGGVFRADLNLGPTKFSYLTKWDTHLGLFDREYVIRQVVGCLEPFLSVREFPRSYNLGIELRLDEFYDVLRRRHFQRPGTEDATPDALPKSFVVSP